MSARDELAEVMVGQHVGDGYYTASVGWDEAREMADEILEAGWRPPARTITTIAELDALPGGSIVLDGDPDALLKTDSGSWRSLTDPEQPYGSGYLTLPATVLYEPTA